MSETNRLRAVIFLAIVLCLPVQVSAKKKDYEGVTTEDGYTIGNVAQIFVAHDVVFFEDKNVSHRLAGILEKLVVSNNLSNDNYRILIINDHVPNAFSGPAGIIYLTTGLLNSVHTDSEIASILAHEIAHHQTGDFMARFDSIHGIQTAKIVAGSVLAAALFVVTVGASAAAMGPMGTATTSSTAISSLGASAMTSSFSVMTSSDTAQRTRLKFAKANVALDTARHPVYVPALVGALSQSIYEGYEQEIEDAAEQKAAIYLQSAGFSTGAAEIVRERVGQVFGKVRQPHLASYILSEEDI